MLDLVADLEYVYRAFSAFSMVHYWSLRSIFLPGSVCAISGRTLGKYTYDDVVILCCKDCRRGFEFWSFQWSF